VIAPRAPLWSRVHLGVVAVGSCWGVALLVIATVATTKARRLGHEIAWLDLAVIGSVVAGAAQMALLVLGRQRVAQRRRRLLALLVEPIVTVADPDAPDLVVVDGGTWVHRADCRLAREKRSRPAPVDTSGMPCVVCGGAR
jgi:hypothetical protein